MNRHHGALVATVAYEDADDDSVLMLKKTPRVAVLRTGSPLTEIDPTLAPREEELVFVKKHASAFFGTSLLQHLQAHSVDTLFIGGVITSGCVRTTAVDAAQFGFRTLVVADATAERSLQAHARSLQVVDELYGGVVSPAEAEALLAAR